MKNLQQNKKYLIITAAIIILLLGIIMMIITSTKTNPQPELNQSKILTPSSNDALKNDKSTKTSNQIPPLSFHNFIPGETTKETIIDTIGRPKKISPQDGYSVEFFPIRGTENYHTIILKNNIAQYIIEAKTKGEPLYSEYVNQIGKKEDGILYNINNNNKGFNLYIFAYEGIGFVNHPEADQTVEIHYFQPTTYNDYLQNAHIFTSNLYNSTTQP